MKTTLRLLQVGQAPSDGEQVRRTLEAEGIGCDFRRVETVGDFVSALDEGGFDLILAPSAERPIRSKRDGRLPRKDDRTKP